MDMAVQFDSLKMFCVLAEKRSFTLAANHLNISQPTLSRRIQQLEETTGLRLVHRGQVVELTPQGRTFLQFCQRTVQELEMTLSVLHDDERQLKGDISIGLLHPMARFLSQGFFGDFHRKHPQIHIKLRTLYPELLQEMQTCDMMIAPFLPSDQSLIAKPLMAYERVFCASPCYLERYGYPQTIAQLSQHQCITHTRGNRSESFWSWQNRAGEQGLIEVEGAMASDSIDICINLAMTGFGIACVPRYQICQQVSDGSLKMLFDGDYYQSGHLYCVYRSRKNLPKRVRVFMDELVDFFFRRENGRSLAGR